MQIVTLYVTSSAAASDKSLYRVEMSLNSLSYARDLLCVARENPLVSYPILDPCSYPSPRRLQRHMLKANATEVLVE